MNFYHFLLNLPSELLDQLAGSEDINVIGNRKEQVKALVGHVKRGSLKREKRVLQFIETNAKPYELRTVISKLKLHQPSEDSELFATIHRNLEPVERVIAERTEIEAEKKERESIPEPAIQDNTVREEDTTEWRENPARLMDIYRSMEYSLGEAIADVIDNSISAKTNIVTVQLAIDEDEGKRNVIIVDDGSGMNENELDHNMDIGSERDYGDRDLGKFGIGLKIASLSQAKEITVLSQKGKDSDWAVRRISYDYVVNSNKSRLLKSHRKTNAVDMALDMLPLEGGTAVLWEEMDDEAINLRSNKARKDFENECTKVRDFLSLVFHRYLTGKTVNKREIQITFNGTSLLPLDPFMEDCRGGGVNNTLIEAETVPFQHEGEEYPVGLKWVILPHTTRMEKPRLERLKKVGGGLNKDQGVYLYRNDRLLLFGGWQGIQNARGTALIIDEHTKLAKLAIDVPQELDKVFKLSATKRHYKIPSGEFRDGLSYNVRESRHMWKDVSGKNISFLKRARQRYDSESVKKSSVKPRRTKREIKFDEKGEYVGVQDEGEAKIRVPQAAKDRKVQVVIDPGSVGGQKLIDSVPAGNTEKIIINSNHPLYSKAVKKLREELKDL